MLVQTVEKVKTYRILFEKTKNKFKFNRKSRNIPKIGRDGLIIPNFGRESQNINGAPRPGDDDIIITTFWV